MRTFIYKLFLPIIIIYIKITFKSIWELREFLYKSNEEHNFLDKQLKTPLKFYFLLRYYEKKLKKLGSWIGYSAKFSGLPYFPHGPMGIFIAHHTKLGKNTIIFHQVTIGSKTTLKSNKEYGAPIIGENVFIGAGAKIIGKITIGNNCRIGANAVVVKDMAENSVAVNVPTRVIKKDKLDNRFFIEQNNKVLYYNNGIWVEKKS